jgi:hypothetical protein
MRASFYYASFVRENSRSIIYALRNTRSSSHSVSSIFSPILNKFLTRYQIPQYETPWKSL